MFTETNYLTSVTNGSHFPIPGSNPANTCNHSYAGAYDNFLSALKDNQTNILWATYLGGTSDEVFYVPVNDYSYHQSKAIDGSNLYLGGLTRTSETQTTPFPLNNNGGSPTYFQPNIDGAMDATITKFDLVPVNVVGIRGHEHSNSSILIYPNPAFDNLFIKFNDKIERASYRIVNAIGQIVAVGNINSDISKISIEKLSAGFYVIELMNNNSNFSAKFVKHD